jgi:hypothetical protein
VVEALPPRANICYERKGHTPKMTAPKAKAKAKPYYAAEPRRALPANRRQLGQHIDHLLGEMRCGIDSTAGLGLCTLGLATYFENTCNANTAEALILGEAACELITNYQQTKASP